MYAIIYQYRQQSNVTIMDCNHDFMDRVIAWCWEHPLTEQANGFLERYDAFKYCKANGLAIKGEIYEQAKLVTQARNYINLIESFAKTFHRHFLQTSWEDILILSAAVVSHKALLQPAKTEIIRLVIKYCFEIKHFLGGDPEKEDVDLLINPRYWEGMIKHLIAKEIDNKHITQQQAEWLWGVYVDNTSKPE